MREVYIFRMETDPLVRVWLGFGPLAVPLDSIETGPATADSYVAYAGIDLDAFPAIEQLLNGNSQRVSITFSGVSPLMLRLANEDRAQVQNAAARIGRLSLDDDLQAVGGVYWESRLFAGTIDLNSAPNGDDRARTITFSLAQADANRSRADLASYTDADQRRRSPDDAFFNQIASYSAGTTVRFGPTG